MTTAMLATCRLVFDQNSNVNYYPCCHADDDARDLIAQKPGDAVDVAGV